MSVAFISHADCGRHDTGWQHPEHVGRLRAIPRALRDDHALFQSLVHHDPRHATVDELALAHDALYIERVRAVVAAGGGRLDADTVASEGSWDAACAATGAVLDAVDMAFDGRALRSFCAVRPPGHHALRDRAMGFCLFGSVAVAARYALARGLADRVLIVDWDVHHGNGTQHIFEADPGVLFISLHGHPDTLYPGTGYAHETGTGAGEGYTLNLPMNPGATDVAYRRAFEESIEPRVAEFEPEFVIISAGFDAHRDDPLGNLALTDDAYAWMTSRAVAMTRGSAKGRLLSVLEGGYNLQVLRRCVEEHVRILEQAS